MPQKLVKQAADRTKVHIANVKWLVREHGLEGNGVQDARLELLAGGPLRHPPLAEEGARLLVPLAKGPHHSQLPLRT